MELREICKIEKTYKEIAATIVKVKTPVNGSC